LRETLAGVPVSLTPELLMHARRAIALAAVLMDRFNEGRQFGILLATSRYRALSPSVVRACGDLQYAAELGHAVPSIRRRAMMLLDEAIARG
jgi:hypothetical protein